jgi:hypothetical protein
LALDSCNVASAVRVSVEQSLRGATGDYSVRHCVRVLLVRVAALADAPFQLHSASLLDDVCSLVGGGVYAGLAGERDVVPGRIGLRADRSARNRRVPTYVGLDAADIMVAEQLRDRLGMRQAASGAGNPLRSYALCRSAMSRRLGRCTDVAARIDRPALSQRISVGPINQ